MNKDTEIMEWLNDHAILLGVIKDNGETEYVKVEGADMCFRDIANQLVLEKNEPEVKTKMGQAEAEAYARELGFTPELYVDDCDHLVIGQGQAPDENGETFWVNWDRHIIITLREGWDVGQHTKNQLTEDEESKMDTLLNEEA